MKKIIKNTTNKEDFITKHKTNEKDFTRKRKLGFREIVYFVLGLSNSCLDKGKLPKYKRINDNYNNTFVNKT